MGLAIWVFASFASAQATPRPSPIQDRKQQQATPAAVPIQQLPHPRVPLALALVPEQTLPQPPEVSWDGKQLTIDAENSKLSDILMAVRAKTGASVDFPGGATERVAVHLGPAPVREVLSSLLYGTDFDYVIQAPDDDEDGLRSVVVTPRGGKSDDTTVVADTPPVRPGMRLMPGYAGPSKPAFQAAAEAAAEKDQSAPENSPAAAESASAGSEAQSPTTEPGAAPAAESASSQPASTDPQPPSTADAGLGGSGDLSSRSTISAAASTTSSSPGSAPLSQAIQDMQRMFQQRQQIQAQQNAAAKAQSN